MTKTEIEKSIKNKLFGDLDFLAIQNNKGFKEDSVREIIIHPILIELGYKQSDIIRSKRLLHPYLKIGSSKRPISLIPDYTLQVKGSYSCVLEAKSPIESVTDSDNIEQVYSYATHPEIRSTYFALCNGIQFALYKREYTSQPVILFSISEINYYWERLKNFLSPTSFQTGKYFTYESLQLASEPLSPEYNSRPLLGAIEVRKRAAKRHYGVHGYFTKQTWNVVAEYIRHFSNPGDTVLDPFGGSGVTAIEAMMNDRKAIHVDINPMSIFLVDSLISPINLSQLTETFNKIKITYLKKEPITKAQIIEALLNYQYPKGFVLPKGSDVEKIEELFTEKQLAQLSFLKYLLSKEKSESIKNTLLLAFSSTLNKINRTYHNSKAASENAGNSGPMLYYRYRIAPEIVDLKLWPTFERKILNIIAAKKEIDFKINSRTIKNIIVKKDSATSLKWIKDESIDYIYTDPPYGKKIPYLDLSIMWNAWLDLPVNNKDYELEAIEGGEHNKTKESYNSLIAESIGEMFRVLKFDRWMSFVFAHKDPEFWHLIIETAERVGFEYVGAVSQSNGHVSFKKKQNPFTVLSGQLIVNFKKVRNPKTIMKAHLGLNITDIIIQSIEGLIAKNTGATLEEINDELIIKGLELGFLDLLKKEYSDLTPLLIDNFDFNKETEKFTIKKNGKFKTHIDVKLRIRYYLMSYLRRMEREGKSPTFDEIEFHILPLLRNGSTPENQTILKILSDIGERIGKDKWRLKIDGQQALFY